MYSPFKIAIKYLQYWLTASNGKGHGIHSPFVYQFINEVLARHHTDTSFTKIEALRKKLLKDERMLEIEDYGAGSVSGLKKQRSVKDIARVSLKSPKYAQMLFRLARFLKAEHIIELGTSLGTTTAYLASSNNRAQVFSFEGASAVKQLATHHFEKLGIDNIQLTEGSFDETLPVFLSSLSTPLDLVFIDGHHTYEATIRYFNWLLPVISEHTVLVFDDIHWSAGMEKAWKEIREHSSVTLSVDLFFLGMVFFRKSQFIPQHFTIRF